MVQAIPVLIGITLASFLLIHFIPGDPAEIILGAHATPKAIAQLNHQLGLDQPLLSQYWDFVSGAFTLDFGDSIKQNTAIGPLIGERLPVTFFLLLYSVVIAILIAVPLAIASALKRNRATDHLESSEKGIARDRELHRGILHLPICLRCIKGGGWLWRSQAHGDALRDMSVDGVCGELVTWWTGVA